MTQTNEMLGELSSLDIAERLALIEMEVQRLRKQLGQNQAEDIWQGRTVKELAEQQGVGPVEDLANLPISGRGTSR